MFALRKLAGRWTLAILRELIGQPARFNQLKKRLPQITGKTLARMLERLRQEGIVRRTVDLAEPQKVTYSLARMDEKLPEVIDAVTAWGEEHYLRRSREEWKRCIEHLRVGPGISVDPLILESWKRSRKTGLDPAPDSVYLRQVPHYELRQRLARNQQLLGVAKPALSAASRAFSSIPHVLYLADKDGIVLHSIGDNALIQAWGLSPGYDWSEKVMGTNGAGTALAVRRPVAVVGPEHYGFAFHDATCLAAPIRLAKRQVIAAIDLSVHVADVKPEQLGRIVKLAKEIEGKLAATRRRGDRLKLR